MFVDIFNTDKKYDIIYADPPWSYENKYPHSSALYEYPTLSLDNLKLLPVEKLANDNSVLFLWFTYPLIKEALELIEAWGFKYKTLGFQWIKLSKTGQKLHWGTGYWTRRNSEGCFIATKGGGIRPLNHDVHELIITPLIKHSKKPNEVRENILKLMGDRPRIELFCREGVNGWDFWGNEVTNSGEFAPIEDHHKIIKSKPLFKL